MKPVKENPYLTPDPQERTHNCPFLTSETVVIGILIHLCTSGEDVVIFATDSLSSGSGMVGPINRV